MSKSIPQFKIEEVREASNIVNLINDYVTLKKKGQNYFGLCPFHNEKTPSFSVNEDKQIFHCFGCGAGGNVFTFLMRYEGTSFPDAVKVLAQKAGIEIEFDDDAEIHPQKNEALYYINEFASHWYQEVLFTPKGEIALDYLKTRGFTIDEIKKFGLGYAPNAWDELLVQAKKTSNDIDSLLNAGLILEREGGGYYDRFRDRVIFPIWNLSGRIVAFGGRVIKSDEKSAKYINSPETAIYEKGKILYGLFQNKDSIRQEKKAIFVEGYMDLLSLVSKGISNVVATSGTSLTDDQAKLIKRYTNHVYLMYDSDSAGAAATLRGADILLENGLEVSIVNLPQGHDPDSYVRQFGKETVLRLLQESLSIFDFKINQIHDLSPEKHTEGVHSILESLSKVQDKIQRSLLLSNLAKELKISEQILWSELESQLNKKVQFQFRPSQITQNINDLSKVTTLTKIEKAAEDLAKILIHNWRYAEFIFNNINLNEIGQIKMYQLLRFFENQFKSGKQITETDLIHNVNDIELTEFIVKEMNSDWSDVDFQQWSLDCVATIKKEGIQRKIDSLRAEIKNNNNSDSKRINDILKECMELEKEKNILFNSQVS